MTSSSVLQAVQHYQRNIEKSSGDVARLLHCVGKLYKLPITVEHLQETGIGRTVNALRKHNGELGIAAETVVNKWKELVASENDKNANNQSSEQNSSDDDDDDDKKDDDDDSKSSADNNSNRHASSEKYSHKSHKDKKSRHKEKNEVSPKSTSTSHRTKDRHDRHHKNDTKESKTHSNHKEKYRKERDSEKNQSDKKHESSSSSSSRKEKKDKRNEHSKKQKREKDEEKNNVEPDSTVEIEKKHKRDEKHKSSKDKEKHRKNDEEKHAHSNSSGSSEKHKSHHKSSENKEKDKEKSKSKTHSHSHSPHHSKISTTPNNSNNEKPSSSTSAVDTTTTSESSSIERKRHHEDSAEKGKSPKKMKISNSSNNESTKRNTKQKTESNEIEVDEDGIDSSMGANFADVLGMLNMPQKKAKKSINALQQQTSPKKPIESENKKTNSSTKLKKSTDYDGPSTSSSASSSLKNLEKKPDLLASNAKLAPLDPSIALELPIISNNYKPLPLNPTVMDCVFNSSTSSSSRAPPRLFSDAEALSHGISSKTIRTKVYSGVKSGQLFQVPPLFDLCIRVLQKNIDAIEYTGGVPFDVLRPVLERASPQQLFVFEEYNPYIMEDSDVLWQQHVQRTYRTHKRQEMETWREMFMRCQDEQERRLSMLAQNIKQSQKIMAEPVRKTQLAFVDSLVKPPRGVIRKQEQFGTKSKLVATPAARVAALSSVTPNAAKTGDARLRAAASIKFDPAQVASAPLKPKKAPLMAKTLQFIRGRQRR